MILGSCCRDSFTILSNSFLSLYKLEVNLRLSIILRHCLTVMVLIQVLNEPFLASYFLMCLNILMKDSCKASFAVWVSPTYLRQIAYSRSPCKSTSWRWANWSSCKSWSINCFMCVCWLNI